MSFLRRFQRAISSTAGTQPDVPASTTTATSTRTSTSTQASRAPKSYLTPDKAKNSDRSPESTYSSESVWSEFDITLLPVSRLPEHDSSGHPAPISPNPFPRSSYSIVAVPDSSGDLLLFGGHFGSGKAEEIVPSNDVYIISTRRHSASLVETAGDVPPAVVYPPCCWAISSTVFAFWGGIPPINSTTSQDWKNCFYVLDLDTRRWTRTATSGSSLQAVYSGRVDMIGSKLLMYYVDGVWGFDIKSLSGRRPSWEKLWTIPKSAKLPQTFISLQQDKLYVFSSGDPEHSSMCDVRSGRLELIPCNGVTPFFHRLRGEVVGNVIYLVDNGNLFALRLDGMESKWFKVQGIGPIQTIVGDLVVIGLDMFFINWQTGHTRVLNTGCLQFPQDESCVVRPYDASSSDCDEGKARPQEPSAVATCRDSGMPPPYSSTPHDKIIAEKQPASSQDSPSVCRTEGTLQRTKVIAITTQSESSCKGRDIAAGADAYIERMSDLSEKERSAVRRILLHLPPRDWIPHLSHILDGPTATQLTLLQHLGDSKLSRTMRRIPDFSVEGLPVPHRRAEQR